MDLSFMQNEIVLALCWTLIHSLWQGLLLATVTGAIMIGTRKSSAGKRYRLLTVLFFVFMAVTMITFVKEYKSISGAGSTTASPTVPFITDPAFFNVRFTETSDVVSKPLLERFKDYFNTHASLIVMIWFVIFIARFIRLAANLVYVNRLKHYKTFAPPAEWDERINELVASLGLKKKIKLLESGVVKVPVVMGVLKPVVLLPLGLLTHLPADEIEAILLHELAHIQRRDYLVNILQNFAETIFFFNPALMWVSSMIREERENCCDDIAISVTNNKSRFINALIAFQEYNFAAKQPSVGFAGRKNQLLNRVKRIINEKNKTLNAAEKSILTFAMGVFLLFSFAAAKKIAPPSVKDVLSSLENKQKDTQVLVTQRDGELKNITTGDVKKIIYDTIKINRGLNEMTIQGGVVVHPDPVILSDTISTIPDRYTYYASMVRLTTLDKPAPVLRIDTVPEKTKSLPLRLSNRSVYGEVVEDRRDAQDSISQQFTNITSNNKNEDITVTATHKNGTEYKFRKQEGVVKEFYINGKSADASEYTKVINDIDRAIEYRRIRSKERREVEIARNKLSLLEKNKRMEERKQVELDRRKQGVEERRQGKLGGEERQKIRLDAEEKRREDFNRDRINLKIDSARHWEKGAEFKMKDLDSIRYNLKRDGKYDKVKEVVNKNADKKFAVKGKWDVNTIYDVKEMPISKVDAKYRVNYDEVVKETNKRIKGKTDSSTWEVVEVEKSKKLTDTEWRRIRAEKDRVIHEEHVKLFRSIIEDLEKEGIKIDLEKGWFALDKGQFVVDGKTMPKLLHEKFIAKYVTSSNGLGYYYGPIQVRGRGLVFDYKDLTR